MKHCPRCKADYHPKFDQCFSCGGELVEGSIEAPADPGTPRDPTAPEDPSPTGGPSPGGSPAGDSEGARLMLERARKMALGGFLVLLVVIGVMVALDPTVPVEKLPPIAIHLQGREALPPGGVIRTEAERRDHAQRHGLDLPPLAEGREMYAYYPFLSASLQLASYPEIRAARHHEGAILVAVEPSEQGAPAGARLMEQALQGIQRGLDPGRPPDYEIVAVGRMALDGRKVLFSVHEQFRSEGLGDSVERASMDFAGDLVLGSYLQLIKYLLFGLGALVLGFWGLTKLA